MTLKLDPPLFLLIDMTDINYSLIQFLFFRIKNA